MKKERSSSTLLVVTTQLCSFPHRVVWGLSHNAVAQKFKAPSKATRNLQYIRNGRWCTPIRCRHFQFFGTLHGAQDIYNEAGDCSSA
ncbi:hypothetical protein BS47DRAFT_1402656 [Hydnum rufescens UP504]|uniref:Uncharacterized protein n=1 Tax=Hydnum rufescens UP504 TaxID=1448309 RepID=A0A9P6ACH0_9AGAM|nr:hypothetical protein BS47DRAFT_1402656 [Hydnum rufescens UP504]